MTSADPNGRAGAIAWVVALSVAVGCAATPPDPGPAEAGGLRLPVGPVAGVVAEAADRTATRSRAAAVGARSVAAGKVAIGGGSGIVFGKGREVTEGSGASCTLTAVGYDRHGNFVGLTNAHCFYDDDEEPVLGDRVYIDESRPGTAQKPNQGSDPDLETGPIGTVRYASERHPMCPGRACGGLDFAVIEFDEDKVGPRSTIGGTTITEIGDPPRPGTKVCKQGRTSGLTCGRVLSAVGDYLTHTILELPGDSGSPVTVGTTLVGNQWMAGGSSSIVAILEALDDLGGVGAGFELPVDSPAQSE